MKFDIKRINKMSKGSLFVIVCSVIVIISFIISCYLMTTVDPPKLTAKTIVEQGRKMLTDLEADEIIGGRSQNLHDSLAPFYRYAPAKLKKSTRQYDKSIFILPYTVKVSPPIDLSWPLPSTDQSISNTTQETVTINMMLNTTGSNLSSAKGHRRSINNYENKIIEGNSNFVILKVIAKDGWPRIEIKLNLDASSQGKKNQMKIGSRLKMHARRDNAEDDIEELKYFTEIKILPNDTVVIDRNNILDMKSSSINYNYSFLKGNETKIKSNISRQAQTLFIPVDTKRSESKLNATTRSNIDSNRIKWLLKPINREAARDNDLKTSSRKSIQGPTKKSAVHNSAGPKLNETKTLNTVSDPINKKNEEHNITMRKSIDENPVLNDIKIINNVNNETKSQSQGNTNAIREIKSKYEPNGTATKAEIFKFRILFDKETKSFTEAYGVNTTFNRANVTVTNKL